MWLLHFIFEGLFVYFFKTAGKHVTLRQNEMIMMVSERVKKINDLKPPVRNQKKEKESYSTDCI